MNQTMVIILEIVALALLGAVNIWLTIKKKTDATYRSIAGMQQREEELNRKLVNEAGEPSLGGQLRPFEERHKAEQQVSEHKENGIKLEIKVITPTAEKRYLTTIRGDVRMGASDTNELVFESGRVGLTEAVLIWRDPTLFFRRLNPENAVYVERNHSRKQLGSELFPVRSLDRFIMQDVVLEIKIMQ